MSALNTTTALDLSDKSEAQATQVRSRAEVAADFANQFLMHRHRGVINCDSYYVIFGNDGFATDQRSRIESADVWRKLRFTTETESGLSRDRHTWALVVIDHARRFDEEELKRLVWDTWMEVCDRFESEGAFSSTTRPQAKSEELTESEE